MKMSQFVAISRAEASSTRRRRGAVSRARTVDHCPTQVSSSATQTTDQTTRWPSTSGAGTLATALKYSGKPPQRPNAARA
jgi:hypothetical protein